MYHIYFAHITYLLTLTRMFVTRQTESLFTSATERTNRIRAFVIADIQR